MRILKLAPKTEAMLARLRERQDRDAQGIAGAIVADVRKRGDRALSHWTKRLDGTDLQKQGMWISKREF
ncbi:MAG TPA: hypothetical protein VGF19_08030, partial [Candidatus Acidoferrum sp.]